MTFELGPNRKLGGETLRQLITGVERFVPVLGSIVAHKVRQRPQPEVFGKHAVRIWQWLGETVADDGQRPRHVGRQRCLKNCSDAPGSLGEFE